MTHVIRNLYYDIADVYDFNVKPWLRDRRYSLKQRWEKFIRPTMPKTYKEIGITIRSFMCLMHITKPDGYVEIHRAFDTKYDSIVKKTWVPFLKREFHYIDLKDEAAVNSSYHILYATVHSVFENKDHFAEAMRDSLNDRNRQILEAKNNWFSPAFGDRIAFAPAGIERGSVKDVNELLEKDYVTIDTEEYALIDGNRVKVSDLIKKPTQYPV